LNVSIGPTNFSVTEFNYSCSYNEVLMVVTVTISVANVKY